MIERFFVLSLGFAGVILAANAVDAAPQCGLRPDVLAALSSQFGETRRGMGIAADNTVMEIFASAVTGSWTLTVTLPTGMTCLVASGQNFETVAEPLPAKGDPA